MSRNGIVAPLKGSRRPVRAIVAVMPTFDLDDAELAAVIAALKEKLDREWQYRMAPRLAPLVSALAKLDPASVPQSAPPRAPLPQASRTRGPALAANSGNQRFQFRVSIDTISLSAHQTGR